MKRRVSQEDRIAVWGLDLLSAILLLLICWQYGFGASLLAFCVSMAGYGTAKLDSVPTYRQWLASTVNSESPEEEKGGKAEN